MITYICYISYYDSETKNTINISSDITYTLVKNATNAKLCYVTSDTYVFKYDTTSTLVGATQATLTAQVQGVTIGKWQYKNSSGSWVDYPSTSDNTSITGGTLVVKPTHAVFNDNVAQIRVTTSDSDVFDTITISKLSGNTWSGSTWDSKSKYTKKTQEEYTKGEMTTITADFRKYPCIEDSISDHSAYLLGAKNGSKLRYDGLKGCIDYKKAAQIIKDGGYATSSTYVSNLCSIIEKWKLTQFDVGASTPAPYNTVKKFPATPFMVRVIIDNLNYRSEPSMNGRVNGQTGIGTFTIMEVKNGWGRLKSGAGWIYLENPEYCTIGNAVATTKPATKTVDELAKEVIKGLWGNGTERKNKLTVAGYDYAKVQNRVNELLK